MRLIERIELRHFRSFDKVDSKKGVEVVNVEDLNIFSGANDSGKSNILRALNLFLNGEVEYSHSYEVDRDFLRNLNRKSSKDFKEKGKGPSFEISILFNIKSLYESKVLPERFWLVKRYRSTSSSPDPVAYSVASSGKRKSLLKIERLESAITKFLKRVKFYHVPAVKDERYFKFLFKKLQDALFERSTKFLSNSNSFNDALQKETVELFRNFSENSGIKANFEIPATLVSFSEYLGVNTEEDIKLFDRGDGIQAMFIPEILEEISRDDKLVIWGFEEPENSYEYKRARELAKSFVEKYSKKHQLFITTHAKEFLALDRNESDGISLYRVFKSVSNTSLVGRYDSSNGFDQRDIEGAFRDSKKNLDDKERRVLEGILDDLGAIEDAKLVQRFEDKIDELKKKVSGYDEKQKLMKVIEKKFEECMYENFKLTRPIVYVEDKYCQPYKIAWMKLNGIKFTKEDLEAVFDLNAPFGIEAKCGSGPLAGKLSETVPDARVVIGVFDFDYEGLQSFKNLKGGDWGSKIGEKQEGIYRQKGNYYAVLLPVPEFRSDYADPTRSNQNNHLEMEHLFSDAVLEKTHMKKGMSDTGGGGSVIELYPDKGDRFWKQIVDLPKKEFINFKPLFDRIQFLIEQGNC